jgi:hypothetical protein
MTEKKVLSRNPTDLINAVLVGAWIGFFFWTAGSLLHNQAQIYAENGLIENTQLCLLVISGLVFLAAAIFEKRPEKPIPLFCSLICYSFALRELDLKKFDVPGALKFVEPGIVRNTTIAAAFVLLLAYAALSDFHYHRKAAARFVRSRPGILLITAAGFMLVSDFFEKHNGIIHHTYFEEMSELFGYVLILMSSLATLPFMKNASIRTVDRSQPLP